LENPNYIGELRTYQKNLLISSITEGVDEFRVFDFGNVPVAPLLVLTQGCSSILMFRTCDA
jgi:hypothetical protein